MAREFSFDTPVLNYRPRAHAKTKARQWLLWPVYAYRVVAPQVRDRQVNVFEKAVLGLCRAGESDVERMAGLLGLHVNLVSAIVQELQARRLLKPSRSLTTLGESLLVEERTEAPDDRPVTVGYVFQDPWSHTLWPRFVADLLVQDTVYRNGYPILRRGSHGKPHLERPFVTLPRALTAPQPPTAAEILAAVKRHRRLLRERTFEAIEEEDGTLSGAAVDSPVIDRISLVSDDPEPHYLVTYLYVPDDDMGIQDWHAADPFGMGSSAVLRQMIQVRLTEDVKLREAVQRLLARVLTSDTQVLENLESIRDLAIQEIESQLKQSIRSVPFLERLVAMEREHQEIQLLQNCPRDKLEDLMVKAAKTLESMFAAMQAQYPTENAHRVFMATDRQFREGLLNGIATEMGFETPLPEAVVWTKPQGVRRACELGGGTLGQRAVAALLAARINRAHPLWQAAERLPDMFTKLAGILELRDRSAHDNQFTLADEEVNRHVAYCYEIIRAFYPA